MSDKKNFRHMPIILSNDGPRLCFVSVKPLRQTLDQTILTNIWLMYTKYTKTIFSCASQIVRNWV